MMWILLINFEQKPELLNFPLTFLVIFFPSTVFVLLSVIPPSKSESFSTFLVHVEFQKTLKCLFSSFLPYDKPLNYLDSDILRTLIALFNVRYVIIELHPLMKRDG